MSLNDGSGGSTPQRQSGDESDSDDYNDHIRPRGLTGLQNLGNTCYLNSAVQSLSNCPPLCQYFLECAPLIRPEKAPMLSKNYLKLMTELWHKKRPSYVVPSGVVAGIKAVHPMFRGYTQQDAQEFLRCLMDQLHEELKVGTCEDSSDSESDDESLEEADDTNNANIACEVGDGHSYQHKASPSPESIRRKSFDSTSSLSSELDYETCDSGLSSETGYPGDRESGDDSDTDTVKLAAERSRTISTDTVGPADDLVANTKEMKETANLLEKQHESDSHSRRKKGRGMEAGDTGDATISRASVSTKDGEMQTRRTGASGTSPHRNHSSHSIQMTKSPKKQPKSKKKKKPVNMRYDSIISQTFDGKILSSVRCLNCETVSTTKETFQDLSLPIPSKDHLHMLHAGHHPGIGGVTPPKGGACGEVHQGWLSWVYTWMKSWFTGPTITLQDCLSAFFSADELKGDNMYSCEKCKKLRNGLKYSKVLELPEILSVHLKRFRHEFYSSKISTYISFPLEGLDMTPYLHKGCKNEVHHYDLVAIICHHGTAGGGHYTAYCLNHLNNQWYEFDDQYVTEVDVSQVINCEAYVLFYRKNNRKMESLRQRVEEVEENESSILKFVLSKQWVNKLNTFAEPGPITNSDFLCKHGGVPPNKVPLIDDLVVEIQQSTWEILHEKFGGGPVCNHLYACMTCQSEHEKLRQRQRLEKETFIQLNDEFQDDNNLSAVYAISMTWYREWETFVREKTDIPPGPIENNRISVIKNGQPMLRPSSDHGQLSVDMWLFLHRIYGGGPEVLIRQASSAPVKVAAAPASSESPASVSSATSTIQSTSPPKPDSKLSHTSSSAPAADSKKLTQSSPPAKVPKVDTNKVTQASASAPVAEATKSAQSPPTASAGSTSVPSVTIGDDSPRRPTLHHSQARTDLSASPDNLSNTVAEPTPDPVPGNKMDAVKPSPREPQMCEVSMTVPVVSEAGDEGPPVNSIVPEALSLVVNGDRDSQGDVIDPKSDPKSSATTYSQPVSHCGDSKLVEKPTNQDFNCDDQSTTDNQNITPAAVVAATDLRSGDQEGRESGYGSRASLPAAGSEEQPVAKPQSQGKKKGQKKNKKGKNMETTRI